MVFASSGMWNVAQGMALHTAAALTQWLNFTACGRVFDQDVDILDMQQWLRERRRRRLYIFSQPTRFYRSARVVSILVKTAVPTDQH